MSGCGEVCDGNGAPSLFYDFENTLTNSSEYNIAVEKCPICTKGDSHLYCAKCVLSEKALLKQRQLPKSNLNPLPSLSLPSPSEHPDLCHTRKENFQLETEPKIRRYSLLEGRCRLHELHVLQHELAVKIDAKLVATYVKDDKKLKTEKIRERLKHLGGRLQMQTIERDEKIMQSKAAGQENAKLTRFLANSKKKYPAKVQELKKRKEKIDVRLKEKECVDEKCLVHRRKIVREMAEYMFKVEPVRDLSKSNDSLDLVTQELEDASSHQYVKGTWAYVDTPKNFQYTIAGARCYASGECVELRQYMSYSAEQKIARVPSCAHGEWAALSHISQFVQCMAATLDVHIPYMTYIPLLNVDTASNDDLTNLLAQVNMNLACLSASQGVYMTSYIPIRTISNLNNILKKDDLGRSQCHSLVITSLLQAVHNEITSPLLYEPLPGEQPEDSNYVIVTESPIIRSPENITTSYAASASSIVTSAVSAVSSIWPWK